MKQQQCPKCDQKHDLYYLIKSNNTRAMFILCPKMKGREQLFVLFVPLVDGLDIPTYLNNSQAYMNLKDSVQVDGEFTNDDRKLLSLWRTARLSPRNMTQEQLELVKRYVKGNPRW